MSVEMICNNLVREKYLSPLDGGGLYPRILAAWPEIKAKIRQVLQSSPAAVDCMTCIALFKLGFDPMLSNPKTVYISLSYDSVETGWPPVLAQIQSLLDSYGFGLHAHLEHNFPSPLAEFPLLPSTTTPTDAEVVEKTVHFNMALPETLETTVNAGADIGATTYVSEAGPDQQLSNPSVGTLGGWLEIRVEGRAGWQIVGLTNYHIVRPCLTGYHVTRTGKALLASGPVEEGTALYKADEEGLRTEGIRKRKKMENPTRAKLNFSLQLNRDTIDEIRSDPRQGQNAIDDLEIKEEHWLAFFDRNKHILGSVPYASGYLQRTNQNGRLDWALIRPAGSDRVGENLLPTSQEWQDRGYMRRHPFCSGGSITSPQQGTSTSIHDMNKGDLVYKIGASTKCTIGQFDALKPDCVIKEERYMQGREANLVSTEFMFIGVQDLPFARWGDSGSIVWDRYGCAVGLLFRGQSPSQSHGWFAYVTPIEDVFASIRHMSGGKIQDIRFLGES